MKNQTLIFALIVAFMPIFISEAQTVKIGSQTFMTENLNVEVFRNGDPIPQAKTKEEMEAFFKAKEPAWCYYDFKKSNGNKYGKMYNGYAMMDARGLAPEGWRIPSEEDFMSLVEFLGGGQQALLKLKSNSGWSDNKNGTNSSGFSATPGGLTSGSDFLNLGYMTHYWSSSPMGENNFFTTLRLSYNDELFYIEIDGKEISNLKDPLIVGIHSGNFSYVRCIKE
jgi:uncharacterized protein (TIGR02145 family)